MRRFYFLWDFLGEQVLNQLQTITIRLTFK